MTQPTENKLHDFFNHKSDANKYLTADQQDDLVKEFGEWEREQKNMHLPATVFICSNFESSARPLIKYLNDHHHPHSKVIVTCANAEVVEGVKITGPIEDYFKD